MFQLLQKNKVGTKPVVREHKKICYTHSEIVGTCKNGL